jgi:ribosomal protein L19
VSGEPRPDRISAGVSKAAAALQVAQRLAQREDRRGVEMRGYVVRANDEIVDIKVLDLSYNGCGIETVVPLAEGEIVKLSVLGRGAVTAKVRWYRSRKAGLLFSSEHEGATAAPERPARVTVAAEALLRRSGKAGYRVSASDLSTNGCKCEFVDRPDIHEHVWIKFEALESLEAEVCWVSGFNVGLTFCTPIHHAVFDLLVQRLSYSSAPSA